ncbi:MAG: hypothetical protein R2822_10435 [Spirosomataceae bacterium]
MPKPPVGLLLYRYTKSREEQVGFTVQWKNIRIATHNLKEVIFKEGQEAPEISYLINELSENERRKGWRLLWDGKTSAGWKTANGDSFPKRGLGYSRWCF